MSLSQIPPKVKLRLWRKSGGRCQYDGCNKPLWHDDLTKTELNTSYIAHVVSDQPDGPRGDPIRSAQLQKDIANLMLLCDVHHRLVDRGDIAGHSEKRLLAMKLAHETRIERVTGIAPSRQSHILLYGANIGENPSPILPRPPSYERAAQALLTEERYPAESTPIFLGTINSTFTDKTTEFWKTESTNLSAQFTKFVTPRLNQGDITHLSVFAVAPQPLLMLLGSLLSDLPATDVYQLHREPPDWKWQPESEQFKFIVTEPPADADGAPALVLALSGSINSDRVMAAFRRPAAVWRVTVSHPNNDFLKSKAQAEEFRRAIRSLMDRIKARHGEHAILHVFPAMPVALAVDFGRILMPKADLPLQIYDQNQALGGFAPALTINSKPTRNPSKSNQTIISTHDNIANKPRRRPR